MDRLGLSDRSGLKGIVLSVGRFYNLLELFMPYFYMSKSNSIPLQVYDPGTASLVPERTYGCLPPDERGLLQCKGNLVPHLNPTAIACCSDQDYCNKR